MKSYTVDYAVKSWVEINVKANSEEEAKEIAKEIIDTVKCTGGRRVNVVDSTYDYAGVRDNDVLNLY